MRRGEISADRKGGMRRADRGHRPAQFLETCQRWCCQQRGWLDDLRAWRDRAIKRGWQSIAGLVGPLVRHAYSRALLDPTAPSIRHV